MRLVTVVKTVDSALIKKEIDQLNGRAWELRNVDATEALRLSQEAYKKAKQIDYEFGIAQSTRNHGYSYSALGNYGKALDYTYKAIELFEAQGDFENVAGMLNILGRTYWELGDYSEALESILEFLAAAQKSGNQALQADALNNLAMINIQLGQPAKAIQQLEQSLPLFQKTNNVRGECFALNNLAMMHFLDQEYDAALHYGLMSQRLAVKNDQTLLEVKVLDTLGQICGATNQPKQALDHLNKALKIAVAHDLKRDELYSHLNIGKILLQTEQVSEAIPHFEAACQIAEHVDSKQAMIDCYEMLAAAHERCGDFEMALAHYKKFHQFDKEVFNEQGDQKLKALEVRFETESARREAKIFRVKNGELEEEIQERKKVEEALRKAKLAAEVANQAKSRFISNVSHELRTPLNGILGYSQILLKDDALSTKQKRAADIIHHSGEHLLLLINDILDISKIEAQKLEIYPAEMNLPKVLQNIVDIFWVRTQEKGIRLIHNFAPNLPTSILADEKRLRQILLNLIGNAIKFTAVGTVTVCVELLALHKTEARLRFSVRDSGMGIEKDDLSKIFEPLVQVGDKKQRAEGTGLGLAISQKLVEAMGSRLQVESEIAIGSHFWFDCTFSISTQSKGTIYLPKAQLAMQVNAFDFERQEVAQESKILRLPAPSSQIIAELLELAMMGDLRTLASKMNTLVTNDQQWQPFSCQIMPLIETYDEEALIKLFAGYLEE